jgi:hypothetical protein
MSNDFKQPLPHGRGSDQSPDREGGVAGVETAGPV